MQRESGVRDGAGESEPCALVGTARTSAATRCQTAQGIGPTQRALSLVMISLLQNLFRKMHTLLQLQLALILMLALLPSTHRSHHPSPLHSFIPGSKPPFSANTSHRSLLCLSSPGLTLGIPWTVSRYCLHHLLPATRPVDHLRPRGHPFQLYPAVTDFVTLNKDYLLTYLSAQVMPLMPTAIRAHKHDAFSLRRPSFSLS